MCLTNVDAKLNLWLGRITHQKFKRHFALLVRRRDGPSSYCFSCETQSQRSLQSYHIGFRCRRARICVTFWSLNHLFHIHLIVVEIACKCPRFYEGCVSTFTLVWSFLKRLKHSKRSYRMQYPRHDFLRDDVYVFYTARPSRWVSFYHSYLFLNSHRSTFLWTFEFDHAI